MPQVSVGERIRSRLQPNHDGVQLGEGPNQRMVDVVIDHETSDTEGESGIDAVGPSDLLPHRLENLLLINSRAGRSATTDSKCAGSLGLLRRVQFDRVGNP